MLTSEALHEIDSHISALSSASHSRLSMPELKARRRELHLWRAQLAESPDNDPALDDIISEVYRSDPLR